MRHCGGLRRVLAAVGFDLSAEVDSPLATPHDGMLEDPESQQKAPLTSQQAQQEQQQRQAGGKAEGSLHFRLEEYGAVQLMLRRAGEAAGLPLLTHFDQIPQPTLDSYMCAPALCLVIEVFRP